jgi:hypothetical protein
MNQGREQKIAETMHRYPILWNAILETGVAFNASLISPTIGEAAFEAAEDKGGNRHIVMVALTALAFDAGLKVAKAMERGDVSVMDVSRN